MDGFEREYIRRALEESGGERAKAALALGISRKSLWQRNGQASPVLIRVGQSKTVTPRRPGALPIDPTRPLKVADSRGTNLA